MHAAVFIVYYELCIDMHHGILAKRIKTVHTYVPVRTVEVYIPWLKSQYSL